MFAADDGDEIGDGIGLLGRECGGGAGLLCLNAGEADAETVAAGGDGVSGGAVDLEILAAEGPVPGGLDDALGLWVVEENGGFVVGFGVDFGFGGVGDGGDAERALVVHEPCHEIGSVAAEVEEGACAVADRIVEPTEEFRLDADLHWPLVAVHGDHAANGAGGFLFMDKIPDFAVAAVPGGFVVDEDGGLVTLGGVLDGAGVLHVDGERLLHHDGNTARGGGFDDFGVGESVTEDGDGFGLGGVEHFVEICEELIGLEVVGFGVFFEQGGFGVPDGDDGDIGGAALGGAEEAGDVAVVESGDGDAEGLGGGGEV